MADLKITDLPVADALDFNTNEPLPIVQQFVTKQVNVARLFAPTENPVIAGINTNVSNLVTRVTTNEGSITTLQNRATANEGNITSLQGRVTNVEAELAALENKILLDTQGVFTSTATSVPFGGGSGFSLVASVNTNGNYTVYIDNENPSEYMVSGSQNWNTNATTIYNRTGTGAILVENAISYGSQNLNRLILQVWGFNNPGRPIYEVMMFSQRVTGVYRLIVTKLGQS